MLCRFHIYPWASDPLFPADRLKNTGHGARTATRRSGSSGRPGNPDGAATPLTRRCDATLAGRSRSENPHPFFLPSVLAFPSPSAFHRAEREPANQTPGISNYVRLCVILLPPDAPRAFQRWAAKEQYRARNSLLRRLFCTGKASTDTGKDSGPSPTSVGIDANDVGCFKGGKRCRRGQTRAIHVWPAMTKTPPFTGSPNIRLRNSVL